jgi:hypothetical protein
MMPFPVDRKYIEQMESKLGVTFPSSFYTGMTKLNGGEIDTGQRYWRLFPVFDTSDKKRLKRTSNDIVRETKSAKDWTCFPEDAVAIGCNDSGDYLIMLPEDGNKSTIKDVVYAWDHETGNTRIVSPNVEILMNTRR